MTRQAFLPGLLQVHAERVDQDGSQPLALNDQAKARRQGSRWPLTLRHSEPDAQDEVGGRSGKSQPSARGTVFVWRSTNPPRAGGGWALMDPYRTSRCRCRCRSRAQNCRQQAADGQRMPLQLAESQPGQWSAC